MTSSEQRMKLLNEEVKRSGLKAVGGGWLEQKWHEEVREVLRRAVILHEANTWHDAGGAGGGRGA